MSDMYNELRHILVHYMDSQNNMCWYYFAFDVTFDFKISGRKQYNSLAAANGCVGCYTYKQSLAF